MFLKRAVSILKRISALRSKTEAPPAGINAGKRSEYMRSYEEMVAVICLIVGITVGAVSIIL